MSLIGYFTVSLWLTRLDFDCVVTVYVGCFGYDWLVLAFGLLFRLRCWLMFGVICQLRLPFELGG